MSEKFPSGTKTPKTNRQTNKRFNRPSIGYMYEGYITMSTKVCNMVIPIIRIVLMIYLMQIPYIVLHIHVFITPILLIMSILLHLLQEKGFYRKLHCKCRCKIKELPFNRISQLMLKRRRYLVESFVWYVKSQRQSSLMTVWRKKGLFKQKIFEGTIRNLIKS